MAHTYFALINLRSI